MSELAKKSEPRETEDQVNDSELKKEEALDFCLLKTPFFPFLHVSLVYIGTYVSLFFREYVYGLSEFIFYLNGVTTVVRNAAWA